MKPDGEIMMKIPNWTIKDFKIKQTTMGYSVYYTHDEKSRCLISRLREVKQATSYIEWLLNFIKELKEKSNASL